MAGYYNRRGQRVFPSKKYKDSSLGERINTLLDDKTNQPTGWAKKFLSSLKDQFEAGKGLSEKQIKYLDKIEKELTEKNDPAWNKEYTEKLKPVAKMIARYYRANPPYFGSLASNIIDDENFVPTRAQYEKMCTNKYALRALRNMEAKPKFENGDLVTIRKNPAGVHGYMAGHLSEKNALVIENDFEETLSPVVGSRQYRIQPLGEEKIYVVEERSLKNYVKKSKKTKA